MKIQKRDGRVVPYEEDKIREAIHKANNEVEERYRASEGLIEEILEDAAGGQTDPDRGAYSGYDRGTSGRAQQIYPGEEVYRIPLPEKLLRKSNTTDESILKLDPE